MRRGRNPSLVSASGPRGFENHVVLETGGRLPPLCTRDSNTSYLLVWPPDFVATTETNTVRVVSGIVTGNHKEVVLHIGTLVYLGGGEARHLDEQLQQTVPPNCQGPYWVVGNVVSPLEATQKPK